MKPCPKNGRTVNRMAVAAASLLSIGCAAANAQDATNTVLAKVGAAYLEPQTGDVTLSLRGVANPCGGGNFYRMYRANPIYKQFYGLVLAATAADKPVFLFFYCDGQLPVLTHGAIVSPSFSP